MGVLPLPTYDAVRISEGECEIAMATEERAAYDGVPAKVLHDQPCRYGRCNEGEDARYEPADLARISMDVLALRALPT
jgi:hypothetical protein